MFGLGSAERFLQVEQSIRSYLVRRLLPLAKADLSSCQVTVPVAGVNTLIRMVHTGDGRGYVMRIYPRSERRRFRTLVAANKLLEQSGVQVPQRLDSIEDYSKSRLAFYVERLVEGLTVAQSRSQPVRAREIAELLIPLHRAKSPLWGEIERPQRGDFSAYCLRRVRHRMRSVRKGLTHATDPAVYRKILDWFAAERPEIASVRQFDLTHDKINPGNLLWAEQENRYYLLDLVTLRYGVKTKDLAALYHEVLRDDPAQIAEFEGVYFAAFPQEERSQNARLWRWFHAYYHLAEAAAQIKRSRAATSKVDLSGSDFYQKFLRQWEQLLAVIGE